MRARAALLLALLSLCGCRSAPQPAGAPPAGWDPTRAEPSELTTAQQVANVAGAPLRAVGAAVVLPLRALFGDPSAPVASDRSDEAIAAALERLEARPAAPLEQRLASQQALAALAASLERRDRQRALRALRGALGDRVARVRASAALALGRVGAGSPEAVGPPLCRLLKDPSPAARGSAVIALGALGDERAGPLIAELVDSPWGEHPYVALACLQAGGQLRVAALAPRARAWLRRPPLDVGWLGKLVAAQALGRLGDSEAIPGLRQALDDDEAYVRAAAALALLELGEEALLLRRLAAARGARARLPLLLAVGKAAPRSAAARDALAGLLAASDGRVRAQAAGALVDAGDPRGVEGLLRGVEASSPYERLYCLGRLQALAGPRVRHGFDGARWRRWWADHPQVLQRPAIAAGRTS